MSHIFALGYFGEVSTALFWLYYIYIY